MLRGQYAGPLWLGLILTAIVGALAAGLVALGNPGNMGICGACFLRDASGAMGFFGGPGPKYFRPELVGVIVGAMILAIATRRFEGRTGSHAATRFFFGVWMAFGALVFLGCPFRMLQRLGGGDAQALIALPGFILGVGLGLLFERRGYSVGKTAIVPSRGVGLVGPVAFAGLFAWFIARGFFPAESGAPPHAPWLIALGISLVAGALLSLTGFCAISAARQIFLGDRKMLIGAAVLMAGYAVVSLATGRFQFGLENQPAAHGDWLWSLLAVMLVGLTGVMVGGCPVRQIVMTGEGNGDAFVTVAGLLIGGAMAQTFGIASTGAGTTPTGRGAVIIGLITAIVFAAYVTWRRRKHDQTQPAPSAESPSRQ